MIEITLKDGSTKKYKKGILAKYASLVSSASKGAVTDVFDQ